jgi:Fingers domain of DNA polymerase lambda
MELVCDSCCTPASDKPSYIAPPGQPTAYAWYLAGCRTLEDVKQRKGGIELSHVQVVGLKYYDGALSHPIRCVGFIRYGTDINARMPREEASEIFGEIKSIGEPSYLASMATVTRHDVRQLFL